ncbi:MAG: VOC family protein [Chlamydiia bacterium]|nr:VOC family protein [Chlamydiia bacterium]
MKLKTKIAKGVSLSCITVSDFSKAKHLFVDILGLEIKDHQEAYNWMEIGGEEGSLLGICQECKEEPCCPVKAGTNAIVSIEVFNLDYSIKHLKSKGVKFYGKVIEIPNEVKMILFEDFDGNKFWLTQGLKQGEEE